MIATAVAALCLHMTAKRAVVAGRTFVFSCVMVSGTQPALKSLAAGSGIVTVALASVALRLGRVGLVINHSPPFARYDQPLFIFFLFFF